MKTNPKHQPLLRGSFSSATVAAVAGVPPSTVRSWTKRHVNAREMWPKLYGDNRKQHARVRKSALKVKAELEAAGEDARWIDETLERMEQSKGLLEYVDVELLQVCALAELTRNGISPAHARGDAEEDSYLLEALTRELAVRAFLVPAAGNGEPLGPNYREKEGGATERYLVAELRNKNASLSIQVLTPSELQAYFVDPARSASTMWTVIDCDALLQRILARLAEVKRGEEPKL
jgi:hypothetical protein